MRRALSSRAWMFVLVSLVAFHLIEPTAGLAADDSRPRLQPRAYTPLPLGEIRPAGWLRDQLQVQADGLSGHLDEFWRDIKESAWIGGKAEGWERTPYWLDGLVPLAYQLDDPTLKAKVRRFVDYILEHQTADGWFGPVGDNDPNHKPYDVWPLFPLYKAMISYAEATNDARVVPALLKGARKIDEVTAREPLYSWARFRAADLAVCLYWLHERTGEPQLLDLANRLRLQAHDWRGQFEAGRFPAKITRGAGLENHGVNIGMGWKTPGVWWRLTGDPRDRAGIDTILRFLDAHHGQATGIFSCDEHLAGPSPSQGTELCTVAEAMFSLEVLISIQGDVALADRLEKLAFNALPATFKKDMTAHQYDQQTNQVVCKVSPERVYTSNGPEANLYGLEPNFGCCTANMHQGWPKFTSHLWMKSPDGGLAAMSYAPCMVSTRIEGKPVRIEVKPKPGYPFPGEAEGTRVTIEIAAAEPITFPLHLRIPGWTKGASLSVDGATVDGDPLAPGTFVSVKRTWGGPRPATLSLTLPMPVRVRRGFHDAISIERGPLVFALNPGAEWKPLRDRPGLPFDDWEVDPRTPWNYALAIDVDHPERSIRFEPGSIGVPPFSSDRAPVVARVRGRRLPGWGLEKNAAAPPPPSPVASDQPEEELTLVPYGCTDLRITEFPVLKP